MFPDIIALSEGKIIVGEMKPRLSRDDFSKLLAILGSDQARERLLMLVSRRLKRSVDAQIKCILCHSEAHVDRLPSVEQWIFSESALYIVEAG